MIKRSTTEFQPETANALQRAPMRSLTGRAQSQQRSAPIRPVLQQPASHLELKFVS
jgi:hypothetical protein